MEINHPDYGDVEPRHCVVVLFGRSEERYYYYHSCCDLEFHKNAKGTAYGTSVLVSDFDTYVEAQAALILLKAAGLEVAIPLAELPECED